MSSAPPLDLTKDLRCPVLLAKWPFFPLSNREEVYYETRLRGQRYYLGLREGRPGLGVATLADLDLVLWATSTQVLLDNAGLVRPQALVVPTTKLLADLGKHGGGRRHKLVAEAVMRLASTEITTNFGRPGMGVNFSWLEHYETPRAEDGRWRLHLTPWLKDRIADREIIKISPEILRMRGVRRRLYLWACAHAGHPRYDRFELAFAEVRLKSASADTPARFYYELRAIIQENNLPGFNLSVENKRKWDYLVIRRTASETYADVAEPHHSPTYDLPTIELKDRPDSDFILKPVEEQKLTGFDLLSSVDQGPTERRRNPALPLFTERKRRLLTSETD